jgi:hypothetical protein
MAALTMLLARFQLVVAALNLDCNLFLYRLGILLGLGNRVEALGRPPCANARRLYLLTPRVLAHTMPEYKVLSEKGNNLGGPNKSRAEAEKRLRQVEVFEHRGG